MEENEKSGLSKMHADHRSEIWAMQNWRSWGSWFSWGSPVGFGIWIVCIGVFLWLLHMANIIH